MWTPPPRAPQRCEMPRSTQRTGFAVGTQRARRSAAPAAARPLATPLAAPQRRLDRRLLPTRREGAIIAAGRSAPVAQWIEHLTSDQAVGGSSPSRRASQLTTKQHITKCQPSAHRGRRTPAATWLPRRHRVPCASPTASWCPGARQADWQGEPRRIRRLGASGQTGSPRPLPSTHTSTCGPVPPPEPTSYARRPSMTSGPPSPSRPSLLPRPRVRWKRLRGNHLVRQGPKSHRGNSRSSRPWRSSDDSRTNARPNSRANRSVTTHLIPWRRGTILEQSRSPAVPGAQQREHDHGLHSCPEERTQRSSEPLRSPVTEPKPTPHILPGIVLCCDRQPSIPRDPAPAALHHKPQQPVPSSTLSLPSRLVLLPLSASVSLFGSRHRVRRFPRLRGL
jgi:hypothetical protein